MAVSRPGAGLLPFRARAHRPRYVAGFPARLRFSS